MPSSTSTSTSITINAVYTYVLSQSHSNRQQIDFICCRHRFPHTSFIVIVIFLSLLFSVFVSRALTHKHNTFATAQPKWFSSFIRFKSANCFGVRNFEIRYNQQITDLVYWNVILKCWNDECYIDHLALSYPIKRRECTFWTFIIP